MIRELREADAAAVARLQIAVNPHQVVTPRTICFLATRENERKRQRDWVAEIDGEIVGYASPRAPCGCARGSTAIPRERGSFNGLASYPAASTRFPRSTRAASTSRSYRGWRGVDFAWPA